MSNIYIQEPPTNGKVRSLQNKWRFGNNILLFLNFANEASELIVVVFLICILTLWH